jgi:hypothetical protein
VVINIPQRALAPRLALQALPDIERQALTAMVLKHRMRTQTPAVE